MLNAPQRTLSTRNSQDEEFLKKWGPPVIVGPFLPAVFATLNITLASVTLNSWQGSCGYPLDEFVAGSLAISYLFLVVFAWVFLGFPYTLKIETLHIEVQILYPFTSLLFLIFVYCILAFISFIIWIVGTAYTALGIFCLRTAPVLYSFSLFLVIIYWIGFFIAAVQIFRLIYGEAIMAKVKEATKGPTQTDLEYKIFDKAFKKYDPKRKQLPTEQLGKFLADVGLVDEDSLPQWATELDPQESGAIAYETLYRWFRAQLEDHNLISGRSGSKTGRSGTKTDEAKSTTRS